MGDVDKIRAILADEAKLTTVSNGVFEAVDTDGSGRISTSELKAALLQVSQEAELPPPSDEQVNLTMEALDADNSGSLDKEEFKVLVRALLTELVS